MFQGYHCRCRHRRHKRRHLKAVDAGRAARRCFANTRHEVTFKSKTDECGAQNVMRFLGVNRPFFHPIFLRTIKQSCLVFFPFSHLLSEQSRGFCTLRTGFNSEKCPRTLSNNKKTPELSHGQKMVLKPKQNTRMTDNQPIFNFNISRLPPTMLLYR